MTSASAAASKANVHLDRELDGIGCGGSAGGSGEGAGESDGGALFPFCCVD